VKPFLSNSSRGSSAGDERFVVAHASVDEHPAPERAVDAFSGAELRPIVVDAEGVAADVAGEDEEVGAVTIHLDGQGAGGFAVDAFERSLAAAQAASGHREDEGEVWRGRSGAEAVLA
jgi:hypothetical protein